MTDYIHDDTYLVNGSVGKGLATRTPWIAILDKDLTTSTREGVYVVFLFSSNYKHVYLTLNQGTTVPGAFGPRLGKKEVSRKSQDLRELLKINNELLCMDGNADIADEKYRAGAVYYTLWDAYDVDKGKDLLALYLNIYQKYKKIIHASNENFDLKRDDYNFQPSQIIYYGAPGTGKSHIIKKKENEGLRCIRTTFHPDSDYATFVGCYKPHRDRDTGHLTYEFVEQAFMEAYVEAWKNPKQEMALVIEEINRGNCAQIFGDIFQLLDRDDDGWSTYPIKADTDICEHMENLAITGYGEMMVKRYGDGKSGYSYMALPPNMSILATMNTSDQSLFPIDSAFKRRWDWQYMPIANGNKGWRISADGNEYDWWEFLEKINALIGEKTSSEDKKLGYYFCKAKDGVIDAKMFVGKVIFYLWNDVFKDYEFEGDAFNDVEGKLTFDKFYKTIDGTTSVVEEKVALFLKNLEVNPIDEQEDEDGNTPTSTGRNFDKFSVNGVGQFGKNRLASESVKKYIELNPNLTTEEVLRSWKGIGVSVPHFVESKEEYDSRTDNSKRSYEIPCGDSVIYVAHNGYGSNGKVYELIEAVNRQNWGIKLALVEQ